MRIELITTGSELLLGFTVNTHVNYIARRLAELGLRLARHTTVADDRLEMRAALAAAWAGSDVVLVTGGLGPTSDDFTRDVAAELLGLPLQRDDRIAAQISERFRRRAMTMPASVLVQAMVPVGATVLQNAHGTAPGLMMGDTRRLMVLLPGPPRELQPMFEEQVLPVVRQRLTGPAAFHCRVLKTVGVPESIVEEMVAPGVRGVPGLELGYCARLGEVDVRLIAADAAVVDDAERRVREVLGRNLCGTGDDRLEAVVVALLAARGQTVALAESCTGGAIAHRLTNVSGASAVFRSGWVAYANATKTRELGVPAALLDQHGAVSEPVARAMAEGARQQAGADYALSATGIAGPTGGTPAKPVGLVFIGLAGPRGTIVRQHQFGFDRESFKQIVSQHALDLLRRELLG